MSARWLIDLSPGTRIAASTARAPLTRRSDGGVTLRRVFAAEHRAQEPLRGLRRAGAAGGFATDLVDERGADDRPLRMAGQRLEVRVGREPEPQRAGKHGVLAHGV